MDRYLLYDRALYLRSYSLGDLLRFLSFTGRDLECEISLVIAFLTSGYVINDYFFFGELLFEYFC